MSIHNDGGKPAGVMTKDTKKHKILRFGERDASNVVLHCGLATTINFATFGNKREFSENSE